jgi:hypothetical protein
MFGLILVMVPVLFLIYLQPNILLSPVAEVAVLVAEVALAVIALRLDFPLHQGVLTR